MNTSADLPRVLVVDDNPDASEVLALLIELEGFAAATARTLAQAREAVTQRPPQLVFLDVNLPDGSGLDLLAPMKADPRTAGARVVMLSGLIDDRVREQALRLGASDYIVKPLGHEQLTALLDAVR
ncbi:PleD family two-component system response regulator [Roseateles sp. DXS20W]|uniref:PleD family two-component system response regulator n=1 Tax=Pelomonas lactea TaxID=3299030 RepID=A0ABW7GKD3_9BURK